MSGTRRRPGLLGPQVEGYQGWLLGLGYTPATVRNMLKELGQVGCWMASEDLAASDLDEARLVEFRAFRRQAGYRRVVGPRALVLLLRYLREIGVTPAALPSRLRWMSSSAGITGGCLRSEAWRRPPCSVTTTPRGGS
jgi:hypothetical protein